MLIIKTRDRRKEWDHLELKTVKESNMRKMALFAFFLISTSVHVAAPAGIFSPSSFPLSHNTALALQGKHVLWELGGFYYYLGSSWSSLLETLGDIEKEMKFLKENVEQLFWGRSGWDLTAKGK